MRVSQVTAVVLLLAVASPAARGEFVFGPATHLGPPISSDAAEEAAFLTEDGLSLYIGRAPSTPEGGYVWDGVGFYVLERASVDVPFTELTRELSPVPAGFSTGLSLTADGLSLFYSSAPSPFDPDDMYEVTRDSADVDFDFGTSVKLGPNVNHDGPDGYGKISSDGLTLIYGSGRPGGEGELDVWMATRATRTDPFDPAVNLAQVNTPYSEATPSLSSDGQALFFTSTRPGGFGDPEAFNEGQDLYVSYREEGAWQEPVNLGPDVNGSDAEWSPMLSADGSTLYFTSTRPSGIPNHPVFPPFVPVMDFYQVSVTRIPDLQAGDADQDLDFDQFDLIQVQQAAKYLTGTPATWGEGDWNGAPGGSQGNPPAGDGVFDQFDLIAAQQTAAFNKGFYAAIQSGGHSNDDQTSVVYYAATGELAVDAPAGVELTSINIDSAAGIFTGSPAQNLGGSFDNDADGNIFKATFGESFGSLSFGNVAQLGLSQDVVMNDLTVVGSLAGGGDLGDVDLIYVPEPASVLLLSLGFVIGLLHFRRANG